MSEEQNVPKENNSDKPNEPINDIPSMFGKTKEDYQKKLDSNLVNQYMDKLKQKQNLPIAIVSGMGAAIIGAILWAIISVSTGFQIGYMAIGVGYIVGFTIKKTGHGITQIYGILGALLSILGCLLGNFLTIIGFAANAENLGYVETLWSADYGLVFQLMLENSSPIDLLFYGFAIFEGYKFSIVKVTDEELAANCSI